mmetsp:Transcript_115144/g.161845  ORF Transcript_115144/g.161845 Transcript_115144/m.161845 type:complete len:91 (-) Transcript_115144:345-617(-)
MTFPNQVACYPTANCTTDDLNTVKANLEAEATAYVSTMFGVEFDNVNCGADVQPNPEGPAAPGQSGAIVSAAISKIAMVATAALGCVMIF